MAISAVALCAIGAEKTLSNELRKMGFSIEAGGFGRVKYKSDIEGLYRSLMGLRTADRVLLELAFFDAIDFDALFDGVSNVPWEEYIAEGMGLKVSKVRTSRSKLGAETSIQAVVHKAAAQRLCSKRGLNRLPSEQGIDEADLRVHIEKNLVSVLLDLSGEPLFKRGYRASGGPAPLRETTAAAIMLLSGWKRKFPLYDPFCGSGTIAIEAALYAWDIAPGLGRRFFLDKLPLGNRDLEHKVREEFFKKVDFSRLVRIYGSDSDATIVASARSNLMRALGLLGYDLSRLNPVNEPLFKVLAIENVLPLDLETKGFIITNPPYGRRLGDVEAAEKIYMELGKLSRKFKGWKLAFITDHPGFESFFGKNADSCREISNGAIQTYLYQYN